MCRQLFHNLRLMEFLKGRQIWFAGTVRINRLKNIPLLWGKDLRKDWGVSFDYRTNKSPNNIAVHWYDNKTVTLVSSFVGVEPINMVSWYDRKTKKTYLCEPTEHCQSIQQVYGWDWQSWYDVLVLQRQLEVPSLVHLYLDSYFGHCLS